MVAALRPTTFCLTLWLGACGSSDDTTQERHPFADAAGRACQATLEKAGAGAPVLSATVTCDGSGRACSSEARSCFQLEIARETFEISNCPACCRGAASSFLSADCSLLSCATDSDCVFSRARCEEGVCFCPDGTCD